MLVNRKLFIKAGDDGADAGAGGDPVADAAEKAAAAAAAAKQAAAEAQGQEPDEEVVEGEDGKKRIRIPKRRFDEAVAKERAKAKAIAQERDEALAALEEATAAIPQPEQTQVDPATEIANFQAAIDQYEDQYEELVRDPERKADAKALRARIRVMQNQLIDYKTALQGELARRRAADDVLYDQSLRSVERQYPELNPDNEAFDQELMDEVVDLMDGLVRRGESKADALRRAVFYTLKPRGSRAEADLRIERETAARMRAAAAARQQPASLRDVGLDHDRAGQRGQAVDVMRMSVSAFDKLSEDTKARLRGDAVGE